MIDQAVFAEEWPILCERFGKDPTSVLAKRYYESLSCRMDTAGFRRACRVIFESADYFPKPDDFLRVVEGSVEDQALGQWKLCDAAMEGRDDPLAQMSETARTVVRILGGIHRLRNIPVASIPFIRKEFLRYYPDVHSRHERENLRLGEWTEEGRQTFRRLTGIDPTGTGESETNLLASEG